VMGRAMPPHTPLARMASRRGRTGGFLLLTAVACCIFKELYPVFVSVRRPAQRAAIQAATALVEVESHSLTTKFVGATAQGAVAATVAAILAACMEPLVNRLIAKRVTFSQAINVRHVAKVFVDTFSTYLLKFPVFEVINAMLSFTSLSGQARGVLNGFLFCTITLPSTNYRYYKSMALEIKASLVYQAYLPTLARDIMYGWSRELTGEMLTKWIAPESQLAKVACFGIAIFVSCVLSSPCNEWRGYTLLNRRKGSKKRPFTEYFKPMNYVRSTAISATIMGIALMFGMLAAPVAEDFCMLFQERHVCAALGMIVMCTVAILTKPKRSATNP